MVVIKGPGGVVSGGSKTPFSREQWNRFRVHADGHVWRFMKPPDKYSAEELEQDEYLPESYETAIAARAEYNNSLVILATSHNEKNKHEQEKDYPAVIEHAHDCLYYARNAVYDFAGCFVGCLC